jgi:hypothetical protein
MNGILTKGMSHGFFQWAFVNLWFGRNADIGYGPI